MTEAIRFDEVHRHFNTQPILRGLSFAVESGEVYALLGRNGSGKTTALRILLGLLEPVWGRTSILGADSRALRPEQRERIGYVSEDHKLVPQRSVERTVDYEAGTRRRFDRGFVESRLKRLGLPLGKHVDKLSRGQRAQLALVLALAGRPEVLVFDDPAMGLDVAMRRELLDAMIDLLSESGTTVLFSTHALADVERLADRVGILHEGSLVVDAPLDLLRRRLQQRFLHLDHADRFNAREVEGLLTVRERPGGMELLLLDADEGRLDHALGGLGHLSKPLVPSLEDVFVELTGGAELTLSEAEA